MPPTIVETKLEDVLVSIQKDLKEIRDDLTDIKVSQAEIRGEVKTLDEKLSGQIKTLDEKVTGIGKRLENQEFVNRGILTALIIALIAGAAKFFGFMPNP
jgi:predicted  nucleic acid-binding Zn-ribbon protein